MEFGAVPLSKAEGAVLAHSVPLPGGRLQKGRVLTAEDVARLAAAGHARVTVARLAPGDVGEDEAAGRLARAIVPDPQAAGLSVTAPHTGRVNFHATASGILIVDPTRVHALNGVDPSITLATLPPFARVRSGTLCGTAKIIAYAVDGAALARAAAAGQGALRVAPVAIRDATLILTEAPGDGSGQTAKLNAKGREAIAGRLDALGIALPEVLSVPHEGAAIARAIGAAHGEMILILTGAATSDLHDDAPEALRAAGGTVARFGMPVDPGNLLFHGRLGKRPVIGLPGCARSPALNGADWVLERLACGLDLTGDDIARMGVGGLLKEIPIRPAPRERRGRNPG